MRDAYKTSENYKIPIIFKREPKSVSIYKQKPEFKKRSNEIFKKEFFIEGENGTILVAGLGKTGIYAVKGQFSSEEEFVKYVCRALRRKGFHIWKKQELL